MTLHVRRGVLALGLMVAGCTSSSGHESASTSSLSTVATTTTSSVPGVQTSGPRTVLSPIGLNVRAHPERTGRVLGTAAQGAVLTVLGYTAAQGGWYEVRGATVTGWISARPTLSAPGEFRSYSAANFSALYPATWNATESPPASVVFRPGPGLVFIEVTSASATSKLPNGRSGYGETGRSEVVVCGVTTELVTFHNQSAGVVPYLGQVQVAVDPRHALGFYGYVPGLGQNLDVFNYLLASATFASKQCLG